MILRKLIISVSGGIKISELRDAETEEKNAGIMSTDNVERLANERQTGYLVAQIVIPF
jgi:hypothetical protein